MFTKSSIRRFKHSLDKADKQLGKKWQSAVVQGAIFLFGKAQDIVPVDQGNLRASGGVRKEGTGWDTVAYVYYTADYAVYVHENVKMRLKGVPRPTHGKYWDAGNGPGSSKFLERPARQYRREIIRVIRKAMKS